jgi:hypothetical protein
VISITN